MRCGKCKSKPVTKTHVKACYNVCDPAKDILHPAVLEYIEKRVVAQGLQNMAQLYWMLSRQAGKSWQKVRFQQEGDKAMAESHRLMLSVNRQRKDSFRKGVQHG